MEHSLDTSLRRYGGNTLLPYDFLVLSLLCWIPGFGAGFMRPDLRRAIVLSALCSLPFAFTEFLFYPEYWTPTFLFDLGDRLGFGIEDFLFVSAIAAGKPPCQGLLRVQAGRVVRPLMGDGEAGWNEF
jgi:hypothetical protein